MHANGKNGSSSSPVKEDTELLQAMRHITKLKSHGKILESEGKAMKISTTDIKKRPYNKKKANIYCCHSGKSQNNSKDVDGLENGQAKSRTSKKRRKRMRQRDNLEIDEGSRLQRRTRYLLVRMKLEQNLIDAYSAEGWKGQSREKIKPDKELQRAKKQILKCKLGIRDAICQLDLLSSVGCMENSAIAPDGSVHHEHIICAKCKLQEAFPDNDIILCDGTCNCAFHQKCLNPPLLTENIPPGDQGWFCKFCESKMEIIETTNAHLGTHFSADSHWQDIFREEAALPEVDCALEEEEWPSDDSEDHDYDPDKIENTRIGSETDGSDDVSSSNSLWSLVEEVPSESETLPVGRDGRPNNARFGSNVGVDSDETTDCEILSRPRQRHVVDYRKLYDEMFGKDGPMGEQNSEDEDWGPHKRKRRKEKESDAANTLMTLSESDKKLLNVCTTNECKIETDGINKRQNYRIPHDAVEKLRLVFAKNELPSRAERKSLSKELGVDFEKINKWFKNARYMALKARKADKGNQIHSVRLDEPELEIDPCRNSNQTGQKDLLSPQLNDLTKHSEKDLERNQSESLDLSPMGKLDSKKDVEEFDEDVCLKKLLKAGAKKKKRSLTSKAGGGKQNPEAELERLFKLKDRVERLRCVLLRYLRQKSSKKAATVSDGRSSIVFVPVAELVEKRR